MQCAHVTRAKKSEYSGVCCHIYVVGKCVGIYLRANTSAGKYGIRYSKQMVIRSRAIACILLTDVLRSKVQVLLLCNTERKMTSQKWDNVLLRSSSM